MPVRDARAVHNCHRVHDGHGVGGEQFPTAVVCMPQCVGELGGLVKPEDSDEDLAESLGPAYFEDVSGPEGGGGQVVTGYGDGFVDEVGGF